MDRITKREGVSYSNTKILLNDLSFREKLPESMVNIINLLMKVNVEELLPGVISLTLTTVITIIKERE